MTGYDNGAYNFQSTSPINLILAVCHLHKQMTVKKMITPFCLAVKVVK